MIFTESTIKISNNVSKMDSTIVLYRGDKNVEIRFTILQSPFKYSNTVATNVIESTNASYGQLVIKTPNSKPPIFSEVSATKEGTVLFTITKEMIDEIEEVGVYTFQIRLMDENKQSRVTIPPVENGIEIKEPIAIEDDNTTNVVGLAKANYAVATLSDVDTPTFDDNGKYIKTNWNDGDIITNTSLNKIEDGIYTTNENVTATKKYVDDNKIAYTISSKVLATVPASDIKIDESITVSNVSINGDRRYYIEFLGSKKSCSVMVNKVMSGIMCSMNGYVIQALNHSTDLTLNVINTNADDTPISTDLVIYEEEIKCLDNKYIENDLIIQNSISLGRIGDIGISSVAIGSGVNASGSGSHAEGANTTASAENSHAEGSNTTASGDYSHAEGSSTQATGNYGSHAEGSGTTASGTASHAEGNCTTASAYYSHAEGDSTTASGDGSHAEGNYTTASAYYSHAEGSDTTASGYYSHAEGSGTTASGDYSHAEGSGTTASSQNQHVQGKYNIEDTNNKYAHIVGNGEDGKNSNAHTLDWEGNAWFAGKLSQEGTPTENKDLVTKKYVDDKVTVKILPVDYNKNCATNVADLEPHSIYMSPNDAKFLYLGYEKLDGSFSGLFLSGNPHGKFIYTGAKDDTKIEVMLEGICRTAYFKTDTVDPHTEKTVFYLTKNNTTEFTPSNDYEPATKKYVDDNILLEQLPILRIDETNKRIYVNCNNMGTYKKYFVPNKYANVYGFSFIYTNEDSSETEIALVGGGMTRDDFILCARNTDTLFILILGGTDKYKYTKSTKTLEKGLYGYLKIGNTQEYTPTNDYNPATKKYVDDNKITYTVSSKVLATIPASDIKLYGEIAVNNISINKDRRYYIEFLGSKKLCSLLINGEIGDLIICSIGNYSIEIHNNTFNISIYIDKINTSDTTDTFTDLIIYEEEVKYLDNKYLETDLTLQNSISLGRIGDIGTGSSAIGYDVEASGDYSHAEGSSTKASGMFSHAEGSTTTASGYASHAEGSATTASADSSHAEGDYTTASGASSHAEGYGSKASSQFQHVQGKYNIEDKDRKYAHIVGNGAGDAKRSNAHTLDWQGNAWYSGKLSQEGTPTEDKDLVTKKYIDDKVASLPQLSFNEAGELVVTINGVSKTFVPKNV